MNTPILSAQELHKLGEKKREEDKHDKALKYLSSALSKYQKEKNYSGEVDCLLSRFLTYKHLFLLNRKTEDFEKAKADVERSVKIAKNKDLKKEIYKCYFNLGEVYNLKEDFQKATVYYKKALDNYFGSDSEKGRYRYHLGEAMYRSGKKKEGKKLMILGFTEIEKGKDIKDSFVINVWKSGCLMRLAELLRNDDSKEAVGYLEQAIKIVNSDKRLIIRKRQLEELMNTF